MTPTTITLAHGGTGVATRYGTDWLYPLVPVLLVGAVIVYLIATGKRGTDRAVIGMWSRISNSLERETGLPAWCAAGLGVGTAALLIAVLGFMWDVAWHIDLGRDKFLFTPAHTMIVMGLAMLGAGAVVSVIFATRERAEVGLRLGILRIPYGALALGALGFGALCGFPLDDMWHKAYGVDVTMWGPTHLLMIGGASFSPLALWLLLTEAGPNVKTTRLIAGRRVALASSVLIGLSTFQGEFDFGVPQFQQLYHPVLIALAASIALVAAREALGRGGAIKAALGFIVLRGVIALVVGSVLNHVVPHFPLYIVAAVVVEAVARYGSKLSSLKRAAVAGVGVGTLGVGAEWVWTNVWGWHPWNTALFPGVVVAVAIAIPGALLGIAIGRVLGYQRIQISGKLLLVAGVAVVALLAIPFPRNDAPIQARITTQEVSPTAVTVAVDLARDLPQPDWFEVLSWQGGEMRDTPLTRTGPTSFATTATVPVGGDWKSMVRYASKDIMVAAPVYLPADPSVNAPEVPVSPSRDVEFQRDTSLLLRETHGGPSWPSAVAYTAIGIVALAWFGLLALAFSRVERHVAANRGVLKQERPELREPPPVAAAPREFERSGSTR
jgi:hypothetical protein